MKRVECPECGVAYPVERLFSHPGDRPMDGKTYTVSCSVCGKQFDTNLKDAFLQRWWRKLRPAGTKEGGP